MTDSVIIKLFIGCLSFLNKIYEKSVIFKFTQFIAGQWKSSLFYNVFGKFFGKVQSVNYASGSLFFKLFFWILRTLGKLITGIISFFRIKDSATYKLILKFNEKTKPVIRQSFVYKLFYD